MSRQHKPVNRMAAVFEGIEPEIPGRSLPMNFFIREWLTKNWPHERAFFRAYPTTRTVAGRIIWMMHVYALNQEGEVVSKMTIHDLARLDHLEAVVKILRMRAGLPAPSHMICKRD